MYDIEIWVLQIVTEVYLSMGWPGVVVLMAIESVAFPLPSELVMPLAGWHLVQARGGPVWWVALAGVYGSLGSLLGAWLVYGVSLKGGRPLLHKYGKYVLITREELDRAEAWFEKYGEWAVFFSRLVPVLRTLISVPAGVSRMNVWKFSIYTFAGSFPWSFGLAFGGYKLGENWERLRAAIQPFELPILLSFVGILAWFAFRRVKAMRAQGRVANSSVAGHPVEGDN
jgi:membrane protein DedA with SNARE-associated domain